ncbi:hypothetical protein K4K57_007271 [Colletotrichum sp. SAR 10_99]|nr:hypothetical protein K4K57_007271 [Colletotrichum sp. SAR 10_99]
MQDFIDVVILYNEDYVKAANTWVRDLRCMLYANPATPDEPPALRHSSYVARIENKRDDALKAKARKEQQKFDRPYITWSNKKRALESSNKTAELEDHVKNKPPLGPTYDQRYQAMFAAADPPTQQAPFATVPIRRQPTSFRGPPSIGNTSAIWRVTLIDQLWQASVAAQRRVDAEFMFLMVALRADKIPIMQDRTKPKIAMQGVDELAKWVILNGDDQLDRLGAASAAGVNHVKRFLSM